MPAPEYSQTAYDYAIIRVVPCIERAEFLNAGILVSCMTQRFLAARVHLNREKLRALCPDADADLLDEHLKNIVRVCDGEGPIGALDARARWHWLVAPRSTMIQIAPAHCGLCDDPHAALETLFARFVAD